MHTIAELRTKVGALRDEVTKIADATPEQWKELDDETRSAIQARGDYAIEEFETTNAELKVAEARAKRVAEVRATVTEVAPGFDAPNQIRKNDPFEGDVRDATRGQLRDRALQVLESRGNSLAPFQKDHLDKLLRTQSDNVNGSQIARRLLVTESEAYRSGFQKAVTQMSPAFTPEEAVAVNEFRAANEGTGSAGGYGIPVLIDPTIILTSGAADAPLLQISRMVTITTDAWKGVASSGVSWSYDAESSTVSDDTPTLVQPSIPVYAARGFIPYSIEVGQDYPGFADEMSALLSQGFIDLVAKGTMVGSGVACPTGVFTALANATNNPAHVVVTTTGSLGAIDTRAAWSSLPERFRPRATWVMSPTVLSKVSAFGNGLAISDFTVNLLADGTSVLTGRPVVVSDYAPGFTGTTGAANVAVIGDFQKFLIVQRAGMQVELVQHLFDTSTGRPTGNRGWFAFARHGHDVIAPNAFRLIANS
jgi:HK97 family phage major capsid protein